MEKQHREPETLAAVHKRTGIPLATLRNTWSKRPGWPTPVGKRGYSHLYDPAEMDAFIRSCQVRPLPDLERGRLYTARQIEEATADLPGGAIKEGTIRSDLSVGRWPAPEDTDGANRWLGSTVLAALGRRQPRTSRRPASGAGEKRRR